MVVSLFKAPKYVKASILVSLGGGLFGLDTGTIGPITSMASFAVTFGSLSSTIHGLIVSVILLPAAISSFFGGHLANSIGRPRAIAIGAGIFGIGAVLEAGSLNLAMLFAGRAIKGLGEGLFLSTCVVYITELSPPQHRGTLASIPQFLTVSGLCAGFFICYGSVHIDSSLSWRLPFALQAGFALVFSLSILKFAPQSPRWLSANGHQDEAHRLWEDLGVGATEREKLTEGAQELPKSVALKDIFAVFAPEARKQTAIGVFLMGMQQASGIDGVLYYAPLLFRAAGLTSSTASFLASGVSALLMLAVTIPAFLFADRWGRMTSTVVGGVLHGSCMLIMGILYASGSVHSTHGLGRWVVIVMIYLFALIYSATWAIGFRVYVSEIQPPKTRAGAASLSLTSNWTVNWIVAFTTPIFLAHSAFGVYFLWGGSCFLVVLVAVLYLPETKGKTLEDIDASFQGRAQTSDSVELEILTTRGCQGAVERSRKLGGARVSTRSSTLS